MTAKTGSRHAALWADRTRLVSTGTAAYTDVIIEKALNATVWDVDGKSYIDFAGGIGALNVGHCHPKVVKAVQDQAAKLIHTSFHVAAYPNYMELCDRLTKIIPSTGEQKAILFNSGSEAVENAVKFARTFTKRQAVISFDHSFHGRTLLCLTLDGKYKPLLQGLGPTPGAIHHARFPNPYRPPVGVSPEDLTAYCLDDLERLWKTDLAPEDTAAIIVEPVQGEGGFIVPSPGFLPALRRLCDTHGIVLIIDEVQSGFGRTGKLFAIEHEGVHADIMTMGKSLSAGMPVSAVVGRKEILDSAPTGAIGGTYGGNPVANAAALAVLDIIKEEDIVAKGASLGAAVKKRFDGWQERFSIVGDSRGQGAMRAIELVSDKKTKTPLPAAQVSAITKACVDAGLIVLKAGVNNNVIRTLMPLTIEPKELEQGLGILEEALARGEKAAG